MKNKLIRIASVVFLTVMLTLGMSVGTMAEEELELGYGEGMILNYGTASIEKATLQNYNLSQGAIDFAVGQMRYSATEIKLYPNGYRLDVSEHDDIMYACRYAAPDLFYMADGYSYSYATVGSKTYLYSIFPEYKLTGKALGIAKSDYNAKIDAIVEMAAELDTDLEKALFYHEYIVANYEYDQTYTIYDAYTMLNRKQGVCQAYTLLYAELLNREGIDNTAVLSDGLCHVWNALKINGEWFLADLTWDDPTYDVPGRVYHSYFLRSRGKFGHLLGNGTRDWVVTDGRSLTYSTRYDSAFWCSYEGWVHPYDGNVYYMDYDGSNSYVYSRDLDALTSSERLFSVKSNLYVPSGGYYPNALGFCGVGDKLYYAISGAHNRAYVYEYDLDDGARRSVFTYTHTCSGTNCSIGILALMPEGNNIRYLSADINNAYNGTVSYFELSVLMDVNGDGTVTNADISLYVRYLSGWKNIGFVTANADANGDGKYNNRDLIAIIKKVNG